MSNTDPFAELDDLKGRLDWTLDTDEERIAAAALEDASDLARMYGKDWDSTSAPRLVRTLVLKAAARYMRNPGGYTQSRAGDETLQWDVTNQGDAGTVYFTKDEQKLLRELAGGTTGVYSVQVVAWGSKLPQNGGYVPVDQGDPFPLYDNDESPWPLNETPYPWSTYPYGYPW